MSKTKRNVRLAAGVLAIIAGIIVWRLENSALIGQGGWVRNFYFFVPGWILIASGAMYIKSMVWSRSAGNRSFATALAGRKDAVDHK